MDDNSLFGVTVICNCKRAKSCIIDNLLIIPIDIINFAKFKIWILKIEKSWNNHRSNDNLSENDRWFEKKSQKNWLSKITIQGFRNWV